jgi:hypothetical protein
MFMPYGLRELLQHALDSEQPNSLTPKAQVGFVDYAEAEMFADNILLYMDTVLEQWQRTNSAPPHYCDDVKAVGFVSTFMWAEAMEWV